MMGRQTSDQAQLFYEFCLDDRVPDNHLLRRTQLRLVQATYGNTFLA